MKKHLPSPKKLTLAIFVSALFVLSLPQISASFLGGKANFGPFPLSSFQVNAQTSKGFFDQILDPIRKFFSRQPGLAPDSLTGQSDLPDLEVTSFNYLGEGQSDPNRVWFRVVNNNRSGFSDSDSSDDVVVRLYGHEGDEYPYTRTPLAELAIPRGVLEENLTTSPSFSYKDNIRNIPDLSQCVALEVCVDDENSVSESDENNNCLFKTFGSCWECYNRKCKGPANIDFCLGAASETWQREDMKEFSVGSYGDAIYANWTYNPVVYRTSERKEVYMIPFQICANEVDFMRPYGWVNGPHSLTGRGGDVLGSFENDAGCNPVFQSGSIGGGRTACAESYFTFRMRDPEEWTSDINYASAILSTPRGRRQVVFVIEGPNLVVRKFVDGEPGGGWDFKAEITNPTDGSVFLDRDGNLTNTKTTDEDGEAGFNIVYTPDRDTATARIAELPNPEQQSDYELVRAFCQDEDGNEVGVPDLGGYTVESVPTEINKKVECSFFNVSPRKIIVEKYIDSDPNPVGGWEITPSVSATSGIPDAKVKPLSTQSTTATFIAFPDFDRTARITLVENVKSGYEFVSAQCYYPGAPQDNNLNPVVGAGEISVEITYIDTNPNHKIINCRFNNTRKTTITVEKYIDGEGPKEGWLITPYIDENGTINPPDPQFTTSDADGRPLSFYVFPSIGAVTQVTLTETVQSGFEFVSVACEYQDGTTVEGDNAQITVPIDYTNPHHGIINCRFNNTRKTTITVEKYIDGEGPKEGWRIAPIVINGTITPPHPQLTTSDSLTYKVYPEIGKKTQVTLTETLKRDYYEFNSVTCEYQDGTTVDGANSQITFPVDYSNPNHENIKCRFNNNTLPSKIGNLKMSFDYKDCVGIPENQLPTPPSSPPDWETCQETAKCRHVIEDIPTCPSGWTEYRKILPLAEDDDGHVGSGNCGGGSGNPCNEDLIVDLGDSYLVSALWWRMHDHERTLEYEAYVSNDGINWNKVDEGGVHTSGEYCVENCSLTTSNQGCLDYLETPSCNCRDSRCIDPKCDNWLARANYPCAVSYDEHLATFREQDIHYFKLHFYGDNAHAHVLDVAMVLCSEPFPEFCNARDDNGTCSAGSCSCSQNSSTHMVNCDYGVDEGWNYTLHNVKPIISTFVNPAPGKITGDLRTPSGLTIPTNSETYSIEVNWSDIWGLIQRNCNARDGNNPNNSPFCHVYNIGFDINLELHARKLSIQVMNPQGSGWIDVGGCIQLNPVVSPNTYSCDLSNALLTGDVPDLHQDYIKLKFTFEAPGCEENQDGICPDEIICGEECTILASPTYDSDCCCNYDLYQDGVIDGRDCGRIATIGDDRYGTRPGDPGYDPFYDVNGDGIIDHGDVLLCTSSCNGKRCDEQLNPILSLSFQKGDANNDNKIDNLDYAIWLASYLKSREADFSGDGVTNELDYVVWWKNYGGKTL